MLWRDILKLLYEVRLQHIFQDVNPVAIGIVTEPVAKLTGGIMYLVVKKPQMLKSPISGQQLMHNIMNTLNITIGQTLDPGLLEEEISDRWITFYL